MKQSAKYHYEKIQAAITAAQDDGYFINATTCCCGEGLFLSENSAWPYGETHDFDVD